MHHAGFHIILAISVKFKEELFQNLDKQLEEPGMRYLTNPCSTPNPQEALWPISNSPEGVLRFPACNLPDKDFIPQTIKFNFPIEHLTFFINNQDPRIYNKFSHVPGKLAFRNNSLTIKAPPPPADVMRPAKIRNHQFQGYRNPSHNPPPQFQEDPFQNFQPYQQPPGIRGINRQTQGPEAFSRTQGSGNYQQPFQPFQFTMAATITTAPNNTQHFAKCPEPSSFSHAASCPGILTTTTFYSTINF